MIYITQLIYIVTGMEDIFDQFEALAIPLLQKYDGKLLLRIRPNTANVVEVNDIEVPYEIHLVSFDKQADLDNFLHDEDRKNFMHLKEQSIRSVLLIKGTVM